MLENLDSWGELIVATGALGAAAFGIVEGLKTWPVGLYGFRALVRELGPLTQTLADAYGQSWEGLLKAQYRDGRGTGPLRKTLRQGIRVGLNTRNVAAIRAGLGLPDLTDEALAAAVETVNAGAEPDDPAYRVVGRFELAADARVDAALALADSHYLTKARSTAGAVAVLLALGAGWALAGTGTEASTDWVVPSLLIGIAAVPVAPISKDLAKGLSQAATALRARK
ncbi:MAG: hypothetical protein MJE66_13335 [Proteobacteria bacterium]|nr:hypothetical protein [Pseudomonadota bacterium]